MVIYSMSTREKLYFQYCPSWEGNIQRVDSLYWLGNWGYTFPYCSAAKAFYFKYDVLLLFLYNSNGSPEFPTVEI